MEQKNHGSPSFINIAALLLFSIVIAVASAATTYFILNSRLNEQYSAAQSTPVSPSQTYIQPTALPVGTTQTVSDETADWKVYRNEKYGYKIKYPQNLKFTVFPPRDNQSLTSMAQLLESSSFNIDYQDNEFRPQKSAISVTIYNSNNLPFEEWLKINSTTRLFGTEPTLEFHEFKKITNNVIVDGFPATEFQYTVLQYISNNVALKKGQYIYEIGYTNVGADDLSNIYRQMFSTFKFLEPV